MYGTLEVALFPKREWEVPAVLTLTLTLTLTLALTLTLTSALPLINDLPALLARAAELEAQIVP